MTRITSASLVLAAVLVFATSQLMSDSANAAEKLRVGRAVPQAFSFVPIDVGMRTGIFAKHGLQIESTAFHGDAKMQQAAAADSIDILVGSGPAMAFIVKGSPIKAICAMAGPPLLLVLVVRPDGPKTIDELKGKKVSVSTVGSLTYWLTAETSRQQGWGPSGIDIKPMGGMKGQIAALGRKDIDGLITDIATALDMEKHGKGRILARFNKIAKDFHIHVIFATNKVIAAKPKALSAFLAGWLETLDYMGKHKAETVKIAMEVMQKDEQISSKTYDEIMPMFSHDCRFNPKALATLAKSFVELKRLPKEPDMSKLYTTAFMPKK